MVGELGEQHTVTNPQIAQLAATLLASATNSSYGVPQAVRDARLIALEVERETWLTRTEAELGIAASGVDSDPGDCG